MIQQLITPELIQYVLIALCIFMIFLAGLGLAMAGVFLWWLRKRSKDNAQR